MFQKDYDQYDHRVGLHKFNSSFCLSGFEQLYDC
jgi:hypothetical protein